MPTGKVIDPEGQQSQPKDWGYIERDDHHYGDESSGSYKGKPKIIPFANPVNPETGTREFAVDDPVKFVVQDRSLDGYEIGVAKFVRHV